MTSHTPRALRMAGLHRLLHGRPRRGQMVAKPVAFCECETLDDGHVLDESGVCVRCRRPHRDASPFGVPPIESGYPFRGHGPGRDW